MEEICMFFMERRTQTARMHLRGLRLMKEEGTLRSLLVRMFRPEG